MGVPEVMVMGQEEAFIPIPAGCPSSTLPKFFLCPFPLLLPFPVHRRDILAFYPHGSDFTCVLEKQFSALSPVQ